MRRAIAAACMLFVVAGCGAPPAVHTIDGEPDLAKITATIPAGFHHGPVVELRRLQSACAAIDHQVGRALSPILTFRYRFELIDAQCEWFRTTDAGRPFPPEAIVGLLVSAGGGSTLDQTVAVLHDERSVGHVGDRAVLDPQTGTLYVVAAGRLWYVQFPGLQPRDPLAGIVHLARALVGTAPAR